ncbi:MAG: hypothetical protein ACYTE6_09285 [Planctomycetota bacterium]|jgi:hypothetical protein
MLSRTRTLDQRLMRRRCVACGYDGSLLRNGFATRCAKCGCDLRKRPARSYVEMEGLSWGDQRRPVGPTGFDPEPHVLSRWFAFLFLVMLMLVTIIALASATLPV